jgi:M6 family metalloprotease-like protein
MRKALAGLVAILSLSLVTAQLSEAAVTPGTKCSKAGATSTYNGKKYTCIKSGKKLIWNKGVAVPKPAPVGSPSASPTPTPTSTPTSTPTVAPTPIATPTPTPRDWAGTRSTDQGYLYDFDAPCAYDQNLPKVFFDLQKALTDANQCAGIYRIAKYELGNNRPVTNLDSTASDLPIKQCQMNEPASSRNQRGFFGLFDANRVRYLNASRVPGPKMVIQIIPIFASDTAQPKNSPETDYSPFADFVAEWARYSSDGESSVQVRYPSDYIEFPNKVSSYDIKHENPHTSVDHVRFGKDVIAAVDSKINFSGANLVIVVVPPGTPFSNFEQGTLKDLVTSEGTIQAGSTMHPYTLTGWNNSKKSIFLTPFMWLHELYHSGIGFDDHYGDQKLDVNTEYGMGWWSLMTPTGGDLSAWEKWIMDFITDSQVHCINPTQPTVRWIAPSSVKTKEKKLIVIPISQTKGIVIESIRPAGLYNKIPKLSEGVLAYVVDLDSIGAHGLGMKLILPTNRNPNQPPFFLSQAPLREGESVISNGFRITIVESGTFGDVVKVEKA